MKLPVILSAFLSSILILDTAAEAPAYNLLKVDNKCPIAKYPTRLFRIEDLPTLDACAQECVATDTCAHFSYGEYNEKMVCMGCNLAHTDTTVEYHKGFKFYELVHPVSDSSEIVNETRFSLTGENIQCPGGPARLFRTDFRDEDADITLDECYGLCRDLPACEHFSYKERANHGNLCFGCNATGVEEEYIENAGFKTYELKPQIFDYSLYRKNRQCSEWSKLQETTTGTRNECADLCKNTGGCGVFSYGEPFAEQADEGKCILCSSAKSHHLAMGYFTYVLPGFEEGGFNDLTCGSVFGDPHFLTFDDVRYDCQGQGEFVLAKSKMGDVLDIHSIFHAINGDFRPTVARSMAIKVDPEVPVLHVTIPDAPEGGETLANGTCPFSFTLGAEERDIGGITEAMEYFKGCYDGKANIFEYQREGSLILNTVITFPDKGARIHITSVGGENAEKFGCRMRVEVCLVPENHCDASNIIGMLGTPDEDQSNDWMDAEGDVLPLPDDLDKRRKQGHPYCMENWCVEKKDSLYSSNTWESHDQCEDYGFDAAELESKIANAPDDLKAECEQVTGADYRECIIDGLFKPDNEDGAAFAADFAAEQGVENELNGLTDQDLEEENANVTSVILQRRNLAVDTCLRTSSTLSCDDTPAPTVSTLSPTGTIEKITLSPTEKPTKTPTTEPPAGSHGDPHFNTWKQEHFEYHGQCDMVLTKDMDFADGLGLEVQIRTKLVRYWSYIKTLAIRIGDDILELEGNADPEPGLIHYWYNFEYNGKIETLGGFPVKLTKSCDIKSFVVIDLSSKYPNQKIVINAWKEFVKIDFQNGTEESFGNTVGLLGDFKTGETLARDGTTVMDDFSEFGSEWQVLPSEDMLFHSVEQPQFPQRCIEPEDPRGERRRRLQEESITEAQAEKACSFIRDQRDRKDCIYDILATQDLDMTGAY